MRPSRFRRPTDEALKSANVTIYDLLGWNEFGDLSKELDVKMPKGTTYFYDMTVGGGDKVDVITTPNAEDVKRITESIRMGRTTPVS